MGRPAEWHEKDGDDNAESVASRAAVADHRHVVHSITAGYATTPAAPKLLELKFGTTVVWSTYLTTPIHVTWPNGFRNPDQNELVSATLAASGTGGVVSTVTLTGHSEP